LKRKIIRKRRKRKKKKRRTRTSILALGGRMAESQNYCRMKNIKNVIPYVNSNLLFNAKRVKMKIHVRRE